MARAPITKTAYLISQGIRTPTPTLHFYVGIVPIEVRGPEPAAWALMYRCEVSGVHRVWGVVRDREELRT